MNRTVVIYERELGEQAEVGRVEWDGSKVTVSGPPHLKTDLASVQDGDVDLTPSAGEKFLDAVLQEFGGNGYLWAEEVEAA